MFKFIKKFFSSRGKKTGVSENADKEFYYEKFGRSSAPAKESAVGRDGDTAGLDRRVPAPADSIDDLSALLVDDAPSPATEPDAPVYENVHFSSDQDTPLYENVFFSSDSTQAETKEENTLNTSKKPVPTPRNIKKSFNHAADGDALGVRDAQNAAHAESQSRAGARESEAAKIANFRKNYDAFLNAEPQALEDLDVPLSGQSGIEFAQERAQIGENISAQQSMVETEFGTDLAYDATASDMGELNIYENVPLDIPDGADMMDVFRDVGDGI